MHRSLRVAFGGFCLDAITERGRQGCQLSGWLAVTFFSAPGMRTAPAPPRDGAGAGEATHRPSLNSAERGFAELTTGSYPTNHQACRTPPTAHTRGENLRAVKKLKNKKKIKKNLIIRLRWNLKLPSNASNAARRLAMQCAGRSQLWPRLDFLQAHVLRGEYCLLCPGLEDCW